MSRGVMMIRASSKRGAQLGGAVARTHTGHKWFPCSALGKRTSEQEH